jgi:hypothetical protein
MTRNLLAGLRFLARFNLSASRLSPSFFLREFGKRSSFGSNIAAIFCTDAA